MREHPCLVRAARALTDSSVKSACKTGDPRCGHRGRGKAAASRCCHAVCSWVAPGERLREGRPSSAEPRKCVGKGVRTMPQTARRGMPLSQPATCQDWQQGLRSSGESGSATYPLVEASSPHVTHPGSRGKMRRPAVYIVPNRGAQRIRPKECTGGAVSVRLGHGQQSGAGLVEG